MKKTKLIVLAIIFLFVLSGIATANSEKSRYLVRSDNAKLKALFGVQHNFKEGFTADLTAAELKLLKKSGIRVEDVPLYSILAKPVCGDGACQGNELTTCPGDCPPQPRTCTPTTKPYGVAMVNGGSGGLGVKVAVLDTGVYQHRDLDLSLCADTTRKGIRAGCDDGNGHGTHVAGIVSADSSNDGLGIYGVAPDTSLFAIKVCGSSGLCWADDIAEGIYYAADKGANIISLSLGSDSVSVIIKEALGYAMNKGVLIGAAAGNDGPADGSIDYPAAHMGMVAVGAIDSAKNVPDWSSRGVNDGDYVIEEREVMFGAPGVNVESTWNDGCYAVLSGTSMATPHVSGLAAKLWQGSAEATKTYLQGLAKLNDLHTPGDDTATGFGLPVSP